MNPRIGWLDCDSLRRSIENDHANGRYAMAMFPSERDCRDAIAKSVDADLSRNLLTANIVSRNTERYLSIAEAMRGLGYEPKDDSSEVYRGACGLPTYTRVRRDRAAVGGDGGDEPYRQV